MLFPCSRFKCVLCGETFAKENQYNRHVATHTGLRPHPCDQCDMRFLYPNKLRAHKLTHAKTHPCGECGEMFKGSRAVAKHMSTVHPKFTTCLDCGKEFQTKSKMNEHMKIHAKDRPMFDCPVNDCSRYLCYIISDTFLAIFDNI